ncbi:MAG: archaemetzincin family Zn-dependent metalloprotease [Sulfolobales archaeon]|nr:archaemetzincin family Zn-dependent metalloprotease [Sulfolobales archaeon]MCX8209192.1 archaemetzincin family Zn-dependent metalloprotease [Sulfolobales archaeon]
MEADVVESVASSLRRALGLEVRLAGSLTIPDELLDSSRRQYLAEPIARLVFNYKSEGAAGLLVADVDAYVPGLNFVFGLAVPRLGVATIYLRRLRLWTDRTNYVERVVKEVLHELGHVFGLRHCGTRDCVMSFSNSVFEVDRKSRAFCRSCALKLGKLGIEVSAEFVI